MLKCRKFGEHSTAIKVKSFLCLTHYFKRSFVNFDTMRLYITRTGCFTTVLVLASHFAMAQKIPNTIGFEQGKQYRITISSEDTVIQQAGGRAIDFITKGTAEHSYKVSAAAAGNYKLHHQMHRIAFQFDGMNQQANFDSDKDEGAYKELLKAEYDATVDATGKVLQTEPESIPEIKPSENLVIVNEMMQNAIRVAYPPEGHSNSFFKVLPGYEVGEGDTWVDSITRNGERSVTEYVLKQISDEDIIIEYKTNTTLQTVSEVMGRDSKTNLKITTTGTITLDKNTRLLKSQVSRSLSTGTKEIMGSTLPLNGKNSTTITVTIE